MQREVGKPHYRVWLEKVPLFQKGLVVHGLEGARVVLQGGTRERSGSFSGVSGLSSGREWLVSGSLAWAKLLVRSTTC